MLQPPHRAQLHLRPLGQEAGPAAGTGARYSAVAQQQLLAAPGCCRYMACRPVLRPNSHGKQACCSWSANDCASTLPINLRRTSPTTRALTLPSGLRKASKRLTRNASMTATGLHHTLNRGAQESAILFIIGRTGRRSFRHAGTSVIIVIIIAMLLLLYTGERSVAQVLVECVQIL